MNDFDVMLMFGAFLALLIFIGAMAHHSGVINQKNQKVAHEFCVRHNFVTYEEFTIYPINESIKFIHCTNDSGIFREVGGV